MDLLWGIIMDVINTQHVNSKRGWDEQWGKRDAGIMKMMFDFAALILDSDANVDESM